MVLRLGTDVDRAAIRSVQVELGWDEPGGRVIHSESFSFDTGGMDGGRRFPGSLVVAPPDAVMAGASAGRVLRVTASLYANVGASGQACGSSRPSRAPA